MSAETKTEPKARKASKRLEGVVTSSQMDKTIVVTVQRQVKHPVVGKYIRRYTQYKAHDEKNEAKKGDRVEIVESRPISKTKRWRLVKVLRTQS